MMPEGNERDVALVSPSEANSEDDADHEDCDERGELLHANEVSSSSIASAPLLHCPDNDADLCDDDDAPGGGFAVVDAPQAALDLVGNGRYQLQLWVVCGLCWSTDGILLATLPFSLPELQSEMGLTAAASACLISAQGLGAALGSLFFGIAADSVGRRAALLAAESACLVSSALAAGAGGFVSLLLGVNAVGFAVGGSLPVAFSLLSESLAERDRDRYLCMMQVWFKIGVVAEIAMGWVLVRFGWRALVAFSAFPPVFVILALATRVRESPTFLHGRGGGASRELGLTHELEKASSFE